jgi:hypothetical protein
VLYLEAKPLTVETRLSLASRPAPTGTSTARSAIVVERAAVRDVLVAVRLDRLVAVRVARLAVEAGFRGVVVCLVVAPFGVLCVVVAIALLPN